MITAEPSSDALIKRLRERGARIAERFGESLRRNRQAARTDWRSARSLWPDFTRG